MFGLADRGTVEVGKAADLCVFDPDTVDPGPLRRLYDFPANGERLTADAPTGMTHVLVNGTPIRVDGEPVVVRRTSGRRPPRGARQGSLTRSPPDGPATRSGRASARPATAPAQQPRHTPAP